MSSATRDRDLDALLHLLDRFPSILIESRTPQGVYRIYPLMSGKYAVEQEGYGFEEMVVSSGFNKRRLATAMVEQMHAACVTTPKPDADPAQPAGAAV